MALSDFYPGFDGWTPAENSAQQKPTSSANVSGPSQSPPATEASNSPYLRTTLPLPLQYSPDTLKQYNRPGLSTFRIAPLPPGGNPAVNAAASSVVTSNLSEFVNVAAAGSNGAVQFNNGGALGGVAQFTWDDVASSLSIIGSLNLSVPFAVVSGGTGTSTPALVQGPDITITGTWPDNTIAVKVQSGVTAGPYTNANVTVDAQGIITAIANGSSGVTVPGAADLTAQTANVSATTLYAVPIAKNGTYEITIYLVVSQAATTSSALPDSRIIYTDQDSSATITVPVTSGLTTNTTSTFAQGTFIVNAKASTNIQFDIGQVTPYASVGATSMQFAYHARAVFLG